MAIPAIAIVAAALAASGGLTIGALGRQPQINALKAEVTRLQEELNHMHGIVKDVLKDIEILQLKMQLNNNADILEEFKGHGETNIGKLVYAYGLKEYIEIKQKFLILNQDIIESEAVFVDAFAMFLDNRTPEGENGDVQKRYIKGYLLEKYGKEIEENIVPDLNEATRVLEEKLKEYQEKEKKTEEATYQKKITPEIECLTLNAEQTRFLFSLQLQKIEYDIKATTKETHRLGKITWKNEWERCILKGLDKDKDAITFFIRDESSLFAQMQAAIEKSKSTTWYYLLALEAVLFTPYTPLNEGKENNKLWKDLHLKSDYMQDKFCTKQNVVTKVTLDKMVKTYNKSIAKLTNKMGKAVINIALTTVLTVATGGLAAAFAPGIAVLLAGDMVAGLSGIALTNASLAFVGGGAMAAGGFGMAGGATLITGGGALLGMFGSVSSIRKHLRV